MGKRGVLVVAAIIPAVILAGCGHQDRDSDSYGSGGTDNTNGDARGRNHDRRSAGACAEWSA